MIHKLPKNTWDKPIKNYKHRPLPKNTWDKKKMKTKNEFKLGDVTFIEKDIPILERVINSLQTNCGKLPEKEFNLSENIIPRFKIIILVAFCFLFLIAGFYLIIWDYKVPNVATGLDNFYQIHQFIGFLGILFSLYISFEAGRLTEKENKCEDSEVKGQIKQKLECLKHNSQTIRNDSDSYRSEEDMKGCNKVFEPRHLGFACGDINALNNEVLLCDKCLNKGEINGRY